MADYIASARSNYFVVKNSTAFQAWCIEHDLDFWNGDCGSPNSYAVAPSQDSGHGEWPWYESDDGDCSQTLFNEIAAHLVDEQVAVFIEAGAENLRYVAGTAVAIHSSGARVDLSISEIYDKARTAFGDEAVITFAEY